MTDGYDQALISAGFALLTADPLLIVYDGVVGPAPDMSKGYVLVYSTVEWPTLAQGNALDGVADCPTVRWICHCVGSTASSSRSILQRVRFALLNKRLAVAGLDLAPIRQEPGVAPPQRDESTGPAVLDTIVTFRASAAS